MEVIENLTKNVESEGERYQYNYRMTRSMYSNIHVYGIEIERLDIKEDEKITNIERNQIALISPKRYKVKEFLKILYDNTVSPVHLIDILGEYVDECVLDFEDSLLLKAMG